MNGSFLSDEVFFESLREDVLEFEEIKTLQKKGEGAAARHLFAAYIRKSLKPERFFLIPYEKPENVYMLPGESEMEAAERIAAHTLVSCGVSYSFGENVDWFANPTYNQYPEWTWQLSRHNDWKLLAHVYRQTKNEKYAEACAKLFQSWVKQAKAPGNVEGYQTLCWRTIECGIRMGANWPYILHTFYQTEAFTDDVIVDWYKSVEEHAIRLKQNHMSGNWLIMEMNGLAHIGILCPVFRESEEWLGYALRTLGEELKRQIYPDGFQYELSTGYHDVVINNFQRLYRTARAYDIPLPKEYFSILEKACEIDVKLMMPDGRVPDINDGGYHSVSKLLEPKLEMFPEQKQLLWAAKRGKEGEKPSYMSMELPYAGFFIMRTGWEESDSWALFDGAPFGRAHQHEDKLSLLFYSGGKMILTEAGNYAYDDSEMRRYVLSSMGHNTVLVDGKGQNRRKWYSWKEEDIQKHSGIKSQIGKDVDYAQARYEKEYGENAEKLAVHERTVYFIKKPLDGQDPFLIVVDRFFADQERTYEALWHLDTEAISIGKESWGEKSFYYAAMKEMRITASESCVGMVVVAGKKGEEWEGFRARSCVQGDYEAIPTVKEKAVGKQVRLVTVLSPIRSEYEILSVEAGNRPEDEDILLRRRDGSVWKEREGQLKEGIWYDI